MCTSSYGYCPVSYTHLDVYKRQLTKRVVWHGHGERIPDDRWWPKKLLNWVPTRQRKRGRTRRKDMDSQTEKKSLQEAGCTEVSGV